MQHIRHWSHFFVYTGAEDICNNKYKHKLKSECLFQSGLAGFLHIVGFIKDNYLLLSAPSLVMMHLVHSKISCRYQFWQDKINLVVIPQAPLGIHASRIIIKML
jgi:hypothetical protein